MEHYPDCDFHQHDGCARYFRCFKCNGPRLTHVSRDRDFYLKSLSTGPFRCTRCYKTIGLFVVHGSGTNLDDSITSHLKMILQEAGDLWLKKAAIKAALPQPIWEEVLEELK